MAEKYTGIEKYMFSDAYNFFLKYKDMQNTDYYWELCIKDARTLYFKYADHPLIRGLVSSTMQQLSHKVNNTVLCGLTPDQWEEKLKVAKQTQFK